MSDNRITHTTERLDPLGAVPVFQKHYNRDRTPLTSRETSVLNLIIEGKRSDEIPLVLEISKNTVDEYRKHILKRTGCQTMEQAVAHAFRQGWVK